MGVFLLKRFYFFDERETFTLTEANVPKNINFRNTPADVFNSGEEATVDAAKTAAFGGPVMFFAFVCPNDKDGTGAETDYGSAWAWGIRGDNIGGKVCQHSAMLLNKAAYDRVNNVFDYNNPPGYSEDGARYGVFTMAHELGHCTSLSDEYVKTEAVMGWSCHLRTVLGTFDDDQEPGRHDVPERRPAHTQHLVSPALDK